MAHMIWCERANGNPMNSARGNRWTGYEVEGDRITRVVRVWARNAMGFQHEEQATFVRVILTSLNANIRAGVWKVVDDPRQDVLVLFDEVESVQS